MVPLLRACGCTAVRSASSARRALELPAGARDLRGAARDPGRQRGGAQAGPADHPDRAVGRGGPGGRGPARRAVPGRRRRRRRRGRRWSSTSTTSRSPGRPRPAARSRPARASGSSGPRWSWAARTRCTWRPTSTWTRSCPGSCGPASRTPASCACRSNGSCCTRRSPRTSWRSSCAPSGTCGSARRSTTRPTSAR